MSKLEPTRTSSDLTATEQLRRMLDERGVEYEGGERSLRWRDRNGVMMQAFPLADGELGMEVWSCTPEQAIAATLGDAPRLPHFWTHDGVLHIEATRMPTRIVVCEGGTCEFVPKRELYASEAENVKLRELVAGIGHLLFTLDVDYCATCPKDSINHPCPVYTVDGGECLYKADLRELGIEVDDGTE